MLSPSTRRAVPSIRMPNCLGPGDTPSKTHAYVVPFVVAHGIDEFTKSVFAGSVKFSHTRSAPSLPVLFQPNMRSTVCPGLTVVAEAPKTSANRGVRTRADASAEDERSRAPVAIAKGPGVAFCTTYRRKPPLKVPAMGWESSRVAHAGSVAFNQSREAVSSPVLFRYKTTW